jgi:hypothetical protein
MMRLIDIELFLITEVGLAILVIALKLIDWHYRASRIYGMVSLS